MKMNKNLSGDNGGDASTAFLSALVDGDEYTIETPNGTARSTGDVKDGYNGGIGYKPQSTGSFGGNRSGE